MEDRGWSAGRYSGRSLWRPAEQAGGHRQGKEAERECGKGQSDIDLLWSREPSPLLESPQRAMAEPTGDGIPLVEFLRSVQQAQVRCCPENLLF